MAGSTMLGGAASGLRKKLMSRGAGCRTLRRVLRPRRRAATSWTGGPDGTPRARQAPAGGSWRRAGARLRGRRAGCGRSSGVAERGAGHCGACCAHGGDRLRHGQAVLMALRGSSKHRPGFHAVVLAIGFVVGGLLTAVARRFFPAGPVKEFLTYGVTPALGPMQLDLMILRLPVGQVATD